MADLSQEFFTAGDGYCIDFGRGMASACRDLRALWGRLVEYLELVGDQAFYGGVLFGVIGGIHQCDEPLAQEVLNEAVQNSTLRNIIVSLQLMVPSDPAGVARLHRALGFDDTPLQQFKELVWHRPLDAFSERDIRDLMLRILDRPNGARIVLEGLDMRLGDGLGDDKLTLGPDLKELGLLASAALLRTIRFSRPDDSTAICLSEVLACCLDEAEFPQETDRVLDAYLESWRAQYDNVWELENVVAVLAEKATFRFLDGIFFDPGIVDDYRSIVFLEGVLKKNPLSGVSVKTLLDWCRRGDFQKRLASGWP